MLTKAKLKKIAVDALDIKVVDLESVKGEQVAVKKLTMGDTFSFRNLPEEEMAVAMILVGVVDEKGKPLFDNVEDIKDLPMDLVTELMELVSEHNEDSTVEAQAKKS